MKSFSSLITLDREFSSSVDAVLLQRLKEKPLPVTVNGLAGGALYAYAIEAAKRLSKEAPVLVLAGNESSMNDISALLNESGLRSAVYKPRELVFHNISASHDNERERLSVLISLLSGELDAVVTTPDAAVGATVPEKLLTSLVTTLKVGVEISPESLVEKLVTLGFTRCEAVESAGQFAKRGGIVDFAVNSDEDPIRVEFFGDEIDRMVSFDPVTQRAISSLDEVRLIPAIEVMLGSRERERVTELLGRLAAKAPTEQSKALLTRELGAVSGGAFLESRDRFIGEIYGGCESLTDYFSSIGKCSVIIIGTNEGEKLLKDRAEKLKESANAMLAEGIISKECIAYAKTPDQYHSFLSENAVLHVNPFSGSAGLGELGGIFGFRTRRTVAYGKNPKMLLEDINSFIKSGYKLILECENKAGIESVARLLEGEGITFGTDGDIASFLSGKGAGIKILEGSFEGFDLIMPKVALLSMAEDEGRLVMAHKRRQRILRKSGGAGQKIMSYADLSVGDYVVHANYGIGLFEGMQSVRIDGVTKDYITIRYAGTDKLFVPCDRLEMIGKYIGARDKDGAVKLSKMGGTDWHRAKSRAKKAVKDIAEKLIQIYAERQRTPGYAFPADSELEEEFAESFEHIETEAQAKAIEDIKSDMMKSVPMNRLLCGDVGFGKTEVALRAAFKAIMGGKQVAILVPTTILALQHYSTALSRMRGYPVNIEMLSRFRTPREQARIISDLKVGKIDVIIGTHKLLGKNIEFRDLGLLIVDEEQRFGVVQKEKLKDMSRNVDVLTLTATPIPRTLNMAINGISDMSILDEAPENRRPVQTYVLEHDDIIINDAIRRELARGGQVLYLHNNIDTIEYVSGRIMRDIPEARVATAHGKMEKDEIEDIWQTLVAGEIDVLVCTTIIETGIDLPSANTLIIENADKMGLSQLHQIRGRVGRSERQAYAYMTYRPGKVLSEVASKRLSAIREFAEFGAGFKVALCDLEIRGAGNLLGAEQHGYIDSVGYDLYVKLLNEAVLEERGEGATARFESSIDFKVDAHIPEYYISASAARMEIYKKISNIRTPSDMYDLYDELQDRFGDLPKPVERLLRVALARSVAEMAKIPKIELRGNSILFYMDKPDLGVWSMVLDRHRGQLIGSAGPAPIVYRLRQGEDPTAALATVAEEYYKELIS